MQYKVLNFNIILTFMKCFNIRIIVVNWGLKRQNDKIYHSKFKPVPSDKITFCLFFRDQGKRYFSA